MVKHGGPRAHAGRPKGSKNKATLEKKAVADAFNQRVLNHADALFNAQFGLAVGSVMIFRIDESEDHHGNIKRDKTLVTDTAEIKQVLDENDGMSGTVDETYYLVTSVMPDNRAIDSMLNRTFGKAAESLEISGPDGGPVEHRVIEPGE